MFASLPPSSASSGPSQSPAARRLCARAFSQSRSNTSQSLTFEPPPSEEVDLLRQGGEAAVQWAVEFPPHFEGSVQAEQNLLDGSRDVLEDAELSPNTVLLHVYDLNEGLQKANEVLAFSSERMAVGGAFHVGVEVFGGEWSYGSYGVCAALPRSATGHKYHCSIYLGQTEYDQIGFVAVLCQMCEEWPAADYQVLAHNCCSFAAELCDELGVGPIPPWVNRFARFLHVGHEAGQSVLIAGWKTSRIVQRVVRRRALATSKVAVRMLPKLARNLTRQAQPQLENVPGDLPTHIEEVESRPSHLNSDESGGEESDQQGQSGNNLPRNTQQDLQRTFPMQQMMVFNIPFVSGNPNFVCGNVHCPNVPKAPRKPMRRQSVAMSVPPPGPGPYRPMPSHPMQPRFDCRSGACTPSFKPVPMPVLKGRRVCSRMGSSCM